MRFGRCREKRLSWTWFVHCIWMFFEVQSIYGDEIDHRFMREYPVAAKALHARLTHLSGLCTKSWEGGQDGRKGRQSYRFSTMGPNREVEIDYSSRLKKPGDPTERILGVNPRIGFQVVKRAPFDEYRMDGFGSNVEYSIKYNHLMGRYLEAPYAIVGNTVYEMIAMRDFKLKSAAREAFEGLDCVKVDFSMGEVEPFDEYSLTLDPKLGWAIRRSEFHPSGLPGGMLSFEVDYREIAGVGAVPNIVRMVDVDLRRYTCTFTDLAEQEFPANRFELGYYGLTEPPARSMTAERPDRLWILMTGGGVFLAISLALRKLARMTAPAD